MLTNNLFIVFCGTFLVLEAANVNFNNRCGYGINVIRTANGQAPVSECNLGAGASCQRSYDSNGMNFKNGWNGKTLAEFTFNSWNNIDFYDLSVIVGYDTPMQITSSTGGPTVTCRNAGCPDAYLFPSDNSKNHGTKSGGTFTVNFCP
uniref:Thaumatin-like protein n=1 Tax=Panagrolaimus superbus TaxID=310955 RepID=A0A914Z2G1_9BILA